MTDWRYERGEGRHKHRWSNDYAGFKPTEKGLVENGPCRAELKGAWNSKRKNPGTEMSSGNG